QLLGSYAQLRHPALNAMRWIVAKAIPSVANQPVFQVLEGDETTNVETVHILPHTKFSEWVPFLMAHIK
ncbi:MAG TPA: hypothetical protein VFJ90_03820, partial [Candidatus Didemnitutus sp.]|nr:hypothetical protein [Candidatus Didemnitutus sp.]